VPVLLWQHPQKSCMHFVCSVLISNQTTNWSKNPQRLQGPTLQQCRHCVSLLQSSQGLWQCGRAKQRQCTHPSRVRLNWWCGRTREKLQPHFRVATTRTRRKSTLLTCALAQFWVIPRNMQCYSVALTARGHTSSNAPCCVRDLLGIETWRRAFRRFLNMGVHDEIAPKPCQQIWRRTT
jgi:hypothetical protein